MLMHTQQSQLSIIMIIVLIKIVEFKLLHMCLILIVYVYRNHKKYCFHKI